MNMAATDSVWRFSKASGGARLVLLALAREADETGRATLPVLKIAELTRLTARTITQCIKDLIGLGEISYRRGGGHSNPNSYSILLSGTGRRETVGTGRFHTSKGTDFPEGASTKTNLRSGSGKSVQGSSKPSRVRVVDTPYGSINNSKQASLLAQPSSSPEKPEPPAGGAVGVPSDAHQLVAALTTAGMLVSWRLSDAEWDRVTALSERWGPEALVDLAARRWNSAQPPRSARYLLRVWEDLPDELPGVTGNVVPLCPGGARQTYRNQVPSAYENGF
ncbi:hypothetical protein ACFYXL_14580 [Streptomyces tsukubensis]|uniref:hypothetical protein n=1 Tax=Streptomyces tsukubensis TaxID=83656 RepID=UPI0036738BEA